MPQNEIRKDINLPGRLSFIVAVATVEEQTLGEIYPSTHGEDRSNNAPAKGICLICDYPMDSSGCPYCGIPT